MMAVVKVVVVRVVAMAAGVKEGARVATATLVVRAWMAMVAVKVAEVMAVEATEVEVMAVATTEVEDMVEEAREVAAQEAEVTVEAERAVAEVVAEREAEDWEGVG